MEQPVGLCGRCGGVAFLHTVFEGGPRAAAGPQAVKRVVPLASGGVVGAYADEIRTVLWDVAPE